MNNGHICAMKLQGVTLMLLATFFFALMNVLVKLVPGIPSVEVVFFRSVVSFVLSIGILWWRRIPIFGTNRKLLLLRGASGAIALILYFYTLQRIPLASAVTIQFLSPIFTTIIGIIMLREKVYPLQWLFFGLAFIGVILVQGFDTRVSFEFLVIGIIAAIFAGLAYNFIRKIQTREHPLVIVFYFPLVTLPITGGISAFDWVTPQGNEWGLLLLIGIVVQIAQYLMTMAYQKDEVSKIASIKYTSIVYALLFGWIVFDENYTFITYSGMGLVLLGVILNVLYKQKKEREKKLFLRDKKE